MFGVGPCIGGDRQTGLLAALDLLERTLRHAVP